MFELKGRV